MLLKLPALLLVLLSAAAARTEPAKVHLSLNWKPEPEFGGFYQAQIDGAFKDANLDVDILPGGSGTPTAQLVDSGKAEFGIVSADELVTLRSKGGDLVALFAVYQTNPQALMTHAGRNLNSLKDLLEAPGTVAWQSGLPYVTHLKKKYDLSKLKQVPYAGGLPFLKAKDFAQQCFVFSEPLTAKADGNDVKTFLVADSGYNPYTGVVVTTRQYLKDHPDQVAAFTKSVQQGWKAYLADPIRANLAMHKLNPSMDLSMFSSAADAQKPLIETPDTTQGGLGSMTEPRWQQLIDQLVEYKAIPAPVKASDCFVPLPK